MKMKKLTLLLAAAALLAACTDEPYVPDEPADSTGNGPYALVLCEGAWGGNDASLARIDIDDGTADKEWFEVCNGRGLGDVAQDIIVYGSKAYVTVTFSNSLEAIDTATGRSTRHALGNLHPRSIAAHDGRLYISCYEGHQVIALDTADLDRQAASYTLGDYQPEGVAVAGGRLFAASSWIQSQNQNYRYDSVVYVFNLADGRLEGTVDVGLNPQTVIALDDNRLAVNYSGNYSDTPAGCAIIDANTLGVTQLGRSATGLATAGGMLYGFSREGYAASSTAEYWRYDGTAFTEINVPSTTPYSISVANDGTIYVTTDGNYTAAGDVICLEPSGNMRWRTEAGMLPKKVVPLQ